MAGSKNTPAEVAQFSVVTSESGRTFAVPNQIQTPVPDGDFWGTYTGLYDNPILSAEDRFVLAQHNIPFTICKAARQDTQYGPQWFLTINLADGDGVLHLWTLALAANEVRETMFAQMEAHLSAGGEPIAAVLEMITAAKTGNQTWRINKPDYDRYNVPY